MQHERHARFLPLVALSAAIFAAACAASEPIDVDAISRNRPGNTGTGGSIDPTGLAGASGPGSAGTTVDTSGSAGASGSTGSPGTAGTGTAGQAGNGGTSGAAGSFGGNTAGQGGSIGGSGGNGAGGSGVGGSFGGSGGAFGTGGRGGSSAGGRGGTGGGAAGHGGTGGSGTPDGGTPDGGTAATFTDIYTNVLVPHCGGSQCHNPGSQKGVSFSSQSNAYSAVKSRVTAGNGTGSSFYSTVNSGSMPPGGPKLSSTDLAKLKAWIDAGALNN
jgi:hypothetical protein